MKYCAEQGCTTLISSGGYCADHKRRKKKKAWQPISKSFYRTQAWKDLKADRYEIDGGCCVRCGRFVFGKRAHHHHVIPIRIRPDLKLDIDNVATACPKCHAILERESEEKYNPNAKKKKFDWKL